MRRFFVPPEAIGGGEVRLPPALARRAGTVIVSLGRRILRAETAAIVHELGELGN